MMTVSIQLRALDTKGQLIVFSNTQLIALLPNRPLTVKTKMTLTKNQHTAILCPPQHEVGFSGSFFRHGDNTPIIKSVFLCLPFFQHAGIHIMMALFGQPFWLVAPCRDTANPLNAVTRFLAVLRDGFTHFRHGITA